MFSFLSSFKTTTDLRNDNVTKTIHMHIFVKIFNEGSTTEIEMDSLNLLVYQIIFSTAIWGHINETRGVNQQLFLTELDGLNLCHIPRRITTVLFFQQVN